MTSAVLGRAPRQPRARRRADRPNPARALPPAPRAPPGQVRRAYRTLRTRAHPDKGGDPALFVAVTRAYEVLGDASKASRGAAPPCGRCCARRPRQRAAAFGRVGGSGLVLPWPAEPRVTCLDGALRLTAPALQQAMSSCTPAPARPSPHPIPARPLRRHRPRRARRRRGLPRGLRRRRLQRPAAPRARRRRRRRCRRAGGWRRRRWRGRAGGADRAAPGGGRGAQPHGGPRGGWRLVGWRWEGPGSCSDLLLLPGPAGSARR
jgi:curved DNA-binding protein CbpA